MERDFDDFLSGYWIELIARHPDSGISIKYNLAQTMIRVKDPKKSLPFYIGQMGMTLLAEKHFPQWKFSLYFLASLPKDAPVLNLLSFGFFSSLFSLFFAAS